ncbi:MAG TPA: SMP-30/gluconolactonase/LRE family protein [Verrucomicrobiae bacterium]|jgi:gluconolactonase|nr:SMP-30/gluconolactonase/LRE family protein [Verrucomicrobiae bacterium]
MDPYEILDPRFRKYTIPIAWLEKLHGGMRWAEGPVYFADLRCLLWSDLPNNRMLRWDEETGQISLFRAPSNFSNGNTRDRQGRLVTCEHQTRRVTRTEHDGTITVIADSYQGKRLNSPNDVVVKSDGTIWFTDPSYGISAEYEGGKAESEIGSCNVYRFDPAKGSLRVVVDDFSRPNGLAFSPDESILYIADSGFWPDPSKPHHIRAFDVAADGKLRKSRVLAEVSPGIPDGFRLDTEGNIWTSAGDGVQCITPGGDLIGKIPVPEKVANVVFGGPKRNRLFICGFTSLYAVYVNAQGAQRP